MTISPGDRQSQEAQRELHALLADDELTETDLAELATDDASLDPEILNAISSVGLEAMSPSAQALLLRLTDYSENLEPATRGRLVSAAESALRWRKNNSAALPVLLFARRRAAKVTPEEISAQIHVPAEALTDIESGASSMRTIEPDEVAAWIHVLNVDFPDAEAALKRGYERRPASPRAAGANPSQLAPDDDGFVTAVLTRLRELQRT